MTLLAIESSCDDTGIAILSDNLSVLSEQVSSQVSAHNLYGGVVPELASRMHTERIHRLCLAVLKDGESSLSDLTAIAVTYGPGLEGALLIGWSFATTLASLLDIPLYPINHLHGHLYSAYLETPDLPFPFMALLVSGGHTLLIRVDGHFDFKIVGRTLDDAAGEAFDKAARKLGLPYPGGPAISKEAEAGNPKAFAFTRPMKGQGPDFSFSGLKTALVQDVDKWVSKNRPLPIADLSASFQAAVVDSLVEKAHLACQREGIRTMMLCGGVAANRALRIQLNEHLAKDGIDLVTAPLAYCGDNAAMIGAAAYFQIRENRPPLAVNGVKPSLSL